MNEQAQRARIIAEARSFIGTPYHHMGRVKGKQGGVDCAQFIWLVFHNRGLTPYLPVAHYPPDFMLHRSVERYLDAVVERAREVAVPQPGDVALYKMGRVFAHGGIVVDPGWPAIIHAHHAAGGVIEDRGDGGRLAGREVRFFSRF